MAKIIKTWHNEDVIASQYYVNENGVRNGDSRTWDEDGVLTTQCNYTDGKIVGTKKFYRKDGTIEREIDYDFDGNPFVVRFFVEDWIKSAEALGLSPAVESLTLDNIIKSFSKLKNERDAFVVKNMDEESKQNAISETKINRNSFPRITFT